MAANPPFATAVAGGQDNIEDYGEIATIDPAFDSDTDEDVDETVNEGVAAVKAYIIDSDEESTNLEVEALDVEFLPSREQKAAIARSKLKKYTIYSVAIIIVLVVAITVPLSFTVLKSDPPDISDAPSYMPSSAPSQAPTSVLYYDYFNKLSEISDPKLLMTPKTAQYRAIRWLYHDDQAGLRNLSDERLFQRYIAAVFYYSTSQGRGWYDCYPGDGKCTSEGEEWFSLSDECKWYGLKCDQNDFVIRIIIEKNANGVPTKHGNGLNGTLPSELGYLTTLKELIIERNPLLTGPIPSTFSKLTSLRKLRFSFNNLEGPWSEGLLDNMTNLDKLDLAYNDFNMTLPRDIGKRTSLEKLDFAGNKIHGSIPSEYGRLYELSSLKLENNHLTGSLPEELFPSDPKEGLKNLKILKLQNNNLNGTLPEEIGNMKLLEKLDLYGNRFSGSIPAAIGEISNLCCLNLTGNDLTGIVPEELCS